MLLYSQNIHLLPVEEIIIPILLVVGLSTISWIIVLPTNLSLLDDSQVQDSLKSNSLKIGVEITEKIYKESS